MNLYSLIFGKYKKKEITLVEIGVKKNTNIGGESLNVWKGYFKKARIIGIDIINQTEFPKIENTEFYQCDCRDTSKLEYIFTKNQIRPTIVIDDGGHTPELHQKSLGYIFPFLINSGLYFIEDLLLCDERFKKSWEKWEINENNNTIKFLKDKNFESNYLDKNKSLYLKNNILKINLAIKKNLAIIKKI